MLIGSHSVGTPDEESDVDVLYVLRDGKRPRERRGKIELIPRRGAAGTSSRRGSKARVAELADAHGFTDVRDAWEGDIEYAMEFQFE